MYARGKRDNDDFHVLSIRFPGTIWAKLVELKTLQDKSVNLMVQEAVDDYVVKKQLEFGINQAQR